jgi:glycosyltransferase involved in cell wall biosynthesis
VPAQSSDLSVKTLSVLTPVHAHARAAEFLTDLYESLRAQHLPSGWNLDWVVQEDGAHPSLADVVDQIVGKDPRVSYRAHRLQGGPAVARNQAFHASRGEVIFPIDHDDYLEPGGLSALIAALMESPGAAWATGRTYEVDEHLVRTERSDFVEPGLVPAGHTLRLWNTHGVSTPWYPTATAYRRWAVELFGGWPANVAAEDTELLACITTAWDGIVVTAHTMTRRLWSGQVTNDPVVISAAADARQVRHNRATLINAWRTSGLLGGPSA